MSEHAAHAPVNQTPTSDAGEKAGTEQIPGNSNLILPYINKDTTYHNVIRRLTNSDKVNRAQIIGQLQRTHGNAYVQRVINGLKQAPLPTIQAATSKSAPTVDQSQHDAQSTPSNTAIQRVSQPDPAPASDTTIQRAPPDAKVMPKIPISFEFTKDINAGKYIKVKTAGLKFSGTIQGNAPLTAIGPAGGGARSGGNNQKVKGVAVEKELAAKSFLADWVQNSFGVNTSEKVGGEVKQTGTKVEGKVAYEGGFDVGKDLITSGSKFTFSQEFAILSFTKDGKGKPEFSALSTTSKATFAVAKDPFLDDLKLEGSIEASLLFEPDWSSLTVLALETPAGWVFAAVAGGILIGTFGYLDAGRRSELFNKVRYQSRSIIKAAPAYANTIIGRTAGGGGKAETDAVAQANTDLNAIVAKAKITKDEYFTLLKDAERDKADGTRAARDYLDGALNNFSDKVEKEVKEWHSAHPFQTFFSGNYSADDLAVTESIIDQEKRNGGNPTIG